jgi:C1A family cysteine protease
MASDQNELKQIQQAIQAKGAQWTAGVNWISQLSREEQRRLCGTILEKPDPSQVSLLTLPFIAGLPAKFDWRNNNGNWITTVTNQLSCGSCWDFSAAAQVEAWWKIYFNQLDSMIDLSEQYVLSCSEGSCEGWNVGDALKFIKNTGVPTENCLPYKADDTIPCTAACLDWQAQAVKIPGWSYITLDEPIVDNIKNAVYQHPLSASFTVYEDFFSYSSGVCEHVWENVEGGHAFLIVGWNDEEKSWLWKSIQKSNKY